MRCAKCGKEIHKVLLNVFNFDGLDDFVEGDIGEIECCDAVYISTYRNWTGYELSEEEQRETILCPHCEQFPFKSDEVNVFDKIEIQCFKGEEEMENPFRPKQEITVGGVKFTIIQTAESWVKCIASECIGNGAFAAKNRNNFAESDIREFLNGEFLQKLIEAGAPEAMFEYFNIDLTADDGLKDYGGDRVRVGLITCDEYRLLRGNIPGLTGTWWWTATPDSSKNNFVRNVYSDGTLNSNNASFGNIGVRPICVLKSEILKSYLDGGEKKRAEAVDMMKHIAAVWNIKPEEIFIPEIEKGESIV
jgi:hypothetical protein